MRSQASSPMMAKPATPPTTPPAIAPTGVVDPFCAAGDDVDDSMIDVVSETGVVGVAGVAEADVALDAIEDEDEVPDNKC